MPGRSVDDMTKYFPRRLLLVPFQLPLLAHRFRFTTSLRHHLQAPKVAFDFDGKASSHESAASSHQPRPLLSCCLMTFMQLHSAAMCRRCHQRHATCECVCASVSEYTYVGHWALHTSASCSLMCTPLHPLFPTFPVSLLFIFVVAFPSSFCAFHCRFYHFLLACFSDFWNFQFVQKFLDAL